MMKRLLDERAVHRSVTRTTGLWTSIALLGGAIFVDDTVTNLEIAVSVLYVSVILISVRSGDPNAVMLVGIVCAILTMLSALLTRGGALWPGLANSVLSLAAIGATTFLAIKIEVARLAARQAQADLAHMSRVIMMSELTMSIVHEISQPLAAIVANSSAASRWLSRRPDGEEEARRAMDRVVKDAERAREVISRMRRMAARVPPSQEHVDLNAIISDSLALVRSQIRENRIMLRTDVASDLPAILGDPVQLQQVVLNMIINGIEASTSMDQSLREMVVGASADDQQITVRVRDYGVGVPPEAVDRVFEAFYTTKPNGMGLGLAISRSIIEAHGGAVFTAPQDPRGMVFGFVLPHSHLKDQRLG